MKSSLLLLAVTLSLGFTACSHKDLKDDSKAEPIAQTETQKSELHTVTKPEDTKKSDNAKYGCIVKKDKRLVELDKKAKRCEVFYTKDGQRNQVAWAESTQNVCQNIFDNIRSNIEKGGFKCATDLTELDKEDRKTASK